jgi:hypothetical protein
LSEAPENVPRVTLVKQKAAAGSQQHKNLLKKPDSVAPVEQVMRDYELELPPFKNCL